MLLSTVIFVLLAGVFQSSFLNRAPYEALHSKPAVGVGTEDSVNLLTKNSGGDMKVGGGVKIVDVITNSITFIDDGPAPLTKSITGGLEASVAAPTREDLPMREDPRVVAALDEVSKGIEIIDGSPEARKLVESYLKELELKGMALKNTRYIIIKGDCPILSKAVAHTTDQYGMHIMEKYILTGTKEGVMGILVHEDAHNGGADELEARRTEDEALNNLGVEHGWCNVKNQREIYDAVVSLHPEYANGKAPVDDTWSETACRSYL